MPTFTFTTKLATDAPSSEKLDYPNYRAARDELVVFVGEILKDEDGSFWRKRSGTVEMTDGSGATLCSMHVFAAETAGMIVAEAGNRSPQHREDQGE